jgi:E3 ubiquitin-protein ligase TRIP12
MLQAISKEYLQLQVSSFLKGFSKVMNIENLKLFMIQELESVISGEDQSIWSYEMLEHSIKPDHGYTLESEPYTHFLRYLE